MSDRRVHITVNSARYVSIEIPNEMLPAFEQVLVAAHDALTIDNADNGLETSPPFELARILLDHIFPG